MTEEQSKPASTKLIEGQYQIMPNEIKLVNRLRALPEDGIFQLIIVKAHRKMICLGITEMKREVIA